MATPLEAITKTLVETYNVPTEKITMEALFEDDLGLDSIDSIELVMKLEDLFQVQVSEDEAKSIKTVWDAVKLIESKKSKA